MKTYSHSITGTKTATADRWRSILLILCAGLFLPFFGCRRVPTQSTKLLILGIDGMDPAILERLISQGRMPHFQKLMEMGSFSKLETSIPPQSPVAWSNFITGLNPGGHAIFDFIHRDPQTMSLYFSTSQAEPGKHSVHLGKWVLPLSGGTVALLRKGSAFWEILQEHGVPTTIIRIPANFPPVATKARQLSGMGTPDILGTYGTFSFYTDEPIDRYATISGGTAYQVQKNGQTYSIRLVGPRNDFLKDAPASSTDITVVVDHEHPVAKLRIQDQEIQLAEKEWSDWVRVKFDLIPWLQSVNGICRFYLKEVRPHFKLYVTPINLDPAAPALPISTPGNYSAELHDHFGMFYTQGIPEDTKALSSEILDDAEFLQQANFVFQEELKMLQYELQRFNSGALFFYFGRIDQLSHMFWRAMDPDHPAHSASSPNAVESAYVEMDKVLDAFLSRLDSQTTLLVLSDHGFAPFYRAFHLTSWLKQEGYASLTDFSEGELLQNVDWQNTRAYCAGFNSLYLNLKGRERQGIVSPGAEREKLLRELTERLLALRDPKNSLPIISRVYRASDVYSGSHSTEAPDLIIGYNRGYRASWETALGKFPREIIRDNREKWSGDHLMETSQVPGVLLSNRKVEKLHPTLLDLAPTILAQFGIRGGEGMNGEDLFSTATVKIGQQ